MVVVLDASAFLAWLQAEPGAEQVDPVLDGALMSTVNWSEVLQRTLARDIPIEGLRSDTEALGVQLKAFDAQQAEQASHFWPLTRSRGLSLGDRACLALAHQNKAVALTADKAWAELELNVKVELIR